MKAAACWGETLTGGEGQGTRGTWSCARVQSLATSEESQLREARWSVSAGARLVAQAAEVEAWMLYATSVDDAHGRANFRYYSLSRASATCSHCLCYVPTRSTHAARTPANS